MDWYTFRASAEARANTVLGRGIMAVNKLTGAVKLGDGHTALKDLEETGGAPSEGGGASGIRKLTASINGTGDPVWSPPGLVIGNLASGEYVLSLQIGVQVGFDPGTQCKVGTPGDNDCFSQGGWDLSVEDAAPAGAQAASGLVVPATQLFPANQNVGPVGGVDIVVTVDNGAGGAPAWGTGVAKVQLMIAGGY